MTMPHKNQTDLRKKPKENSWKKILWELEEQDAFGKGNDGGYTIYGDFSGKSIEAFTERWPFTVVPFVEKGLHIFFKDMRWFEDLRFGFDAIRGYFSLWRKNRVIPEGGGWPKIVDAPLNWDFHRNYGLYFEGSRYIAITETVEPYRQYFYMDRVI
jgi:hypothetical protein